MNDVEYKEHQKDCLHTELAVLGQRFRNMDVTDIEAAKKNCVEQIVKACAWWDNPIVPEDVTMKHTEGPPGIYEIIGFEISSLTLP